MADSVELVWLTVTPYWANEPMLAIFSRASLDYWLERIKATDGYSWGDVEDSATWGVYREIIEACGFDGLDDYTKCVDAGTVPPFPEDDESDEAEAFDEFYENIGVPNPRHSFDIEEFPPYVDGDWPPHPGSLSSDDLPEDLLEKFSDITETIFNGELANIPATKRDELFAALLERGFTLTEEPAVHKIAMARG